MQQPHSTTTAHTQKKKGCPHVWGQNPQSSLCGPQPMTFDCHEKQDCVSPKAKKSQGRQKTPVSRSKNEVRSTLVLEEPVKRDTSSVRFCNNSTSNNYNCMDRKEGQNWFAPVELGSVGSLNASRGLADRERSIQNPEQHRMLNGNVLWAKPGLPMHSGRESRDLGPQCHHTVAAAKLWYRRVKNCR